MSYASHHAKAPRSATAAILTISDTKRDADDASGRAIQRALTDAGHKVAARDWVVDDADQIAGSARKLLADARVQALITTGGTGVTPRDVTIEALRPLFAKELPGFGEAFRRQSEATIGSGAILSRATAGISLVGGRAQALFLLPGAPEACELAVRNLINPELGHLVELAAGRPHAHA